MNTKMTTMSKQAMIQACRSSDRRAESHAGCIPH